MAAEIRRQSGRALVAPLDITDSTAVRGAIAGLERLDVLVNNAGLNRPQPFLDVDEDTLDRLLTLNVRAAFLTAQAAARRMVAEGSGVIINVSSQMGHVGSERDRTVYVMTKHALEGLTKAMAVELAPKGMRVVSIAPTFIDTPLVRPFFDDPTFKQMGARPHPDRKARHRRGGSVGGRLSGVTRRRPRHRLVAARRRWLDRLVSACCSDRTGRYRPGGRSSPSSASERRAGYPRISRQAARTCDCRTECGARRSAGFDDDCVASRRYGKRRA